MSRGVVALLEMTEWEDVSDSSVRVEVEESAEWDPSSAPAA